MSRFVGFLVLGLTLTACAPKTGDQKVPDPGILSGVGMVFVPPAGWSRLADSEFQTQVVGPMEAAHQVPGGWVPRPVVAFQSADQSSCVVSFLEPPGTPRAATLDDASSLAQGFARRLGALGTVEQTEFPQKGLHVFHLRLVTDRLVLLRLHQVSPRGTLVQIDFSILRSRFDQEKGALEASFASLGAETPGL